MENKRHEGDARKEFERLRGKYLTFRLGLEEYGFEVRKVREIIRIMDITRLPRTPEFVKGVINLRGKVVPVVDLRLRFGMAERPYDEKTCIIVVEVREGDTMIPLGVIVDTVKEVLPFTPEDLDPVPDFGIPLDTAFILAMAKGKGTVSALVDIDKVLTAEELHMLPQTE
jgi:purine-binding chemotaxis protein CheW